MNTTITDKSILFSKKGLKELKRAIAQLERDRLRELQSLRESDKSLGRDERLSRIEKISNIEMIESELEDKKTLLANAKLLPSKRNRLQVAIGSVVELIDKQGKLLRYKIVNSNEVNPSDGRISALSPLGQSLLGRNVTDVVEFGNGKKTNQFKLIRIT